MQLVAGSEIIAFYNFSGFVATFSCQLLHIVSVLLEWYASYFTIC